MVVSREPKKGKARANDPHIRRSMVNKKGYENDVVLLWSSYIVTGFFTECRLNYDTK